MPRSYKVVVSHDENALMDLADRDGLTVLRPVRDFADLDLLHDETLGDIGTLFTRRSGFIALAYKDSPDPA